MKEKGKKIGGVLNKQSERKKGVHCPKEKVSTLLSGVGTRKSKEQSRGKKPYKKNKNPVGGS